jgi:hypothetical protein
VFLTFLLDFACIRSKLSSLPKDPATKDRDCKAFTTFPSPAIPAPSTAREYFSFLPEVSQGVLFPPAMNKAAIKNGLTNKLRTDVRCKLENLLVQSLRKNAVACPEANAAILAHDIEMGLLKVSKV